MDHVPIISISLVRIRTNDAGHGNFTRESLGSHIMRFRWRSWLKYLWRIPPSHLKEDWSFIWWYLKPAWTYFLPADWIRS